MSHYLQMYELFAEIE